MLARERERLVTQTMQEKRGKDRNYRGPKYLIIAFQARIHASSLDRVPRGVAESNIPVTGSNYTGPTLQAINYRALLQ